jgi:hypothetical protein
MGTVVERERKDGTMSFAAQIAIKKDGRAVHREAKTFDRRQATFAWLENREKELKAPGGLVRRDDVPLRNATDRY